METFAAWLSALLQIAAGAIELIFVARAVRRRLNALSVLLFAGGYCLCSLATNSYTVDAAAPILETVLLFLICRFCLHAPAVSSLTSALLAVSLVQFGTGIAASIQMLVLPASYAAVVYVLTALLGPALGAAFCWAALRLLPQDTEERAFAGLLIVPLLFFCGAELFVLRTAYTAVHVPISEEERTANVWLFVLQILGAGAFLLTIAACRRAVQSLQQRADLDALKQAASAQRAYVRDASMRYERTRAVRHDLQNHLTTLDGLLKEGQLDEARAYLSAMQADAKSAAIPKYTGRGPVDVIISEKRHAAREAGIDVQVDAPIPAAAKVEDYDLCVIAANALDNAIAACERGSGRKWIHLSSARQGDFLLLTVENSADGTLPARPGTGMRSMKTAAERYSGTLSYEESQGTFTLRVLLDISGQQKDSS